MNFNEHDKVFDSESATPRLSLVVSSVTARVEQNTWNLKVTASMNSVTIKDYFNSGGGGSGEVGVVEGVEPELLLAAVAEDDQEMGKFLSVEYIKVGLTKLYSCSAKLVCNVLFCLWKDWDWDLL